MWGFPDGSFYAVGDAGTVLHYQAGAWSILDPAVRADLNDIWASGPNDVYAVGAHGMLVHYNGVSWSALSVPTSVDLYAIWLNSANDLFIAGTDGNVWNRYNGAWSSYAVAPGRRLRALLGYSHSEVYVCGSNATLFRFNGTTWTKVAIGVALQGDNEFRDIWGPGPGKYGFISGRGLTWTDGSTWSTIPEANNYFPYGCWGVSLDNQVMVAAGLSTHLQDGVDTAYPTPTPEPLYDVWGPAKNNYYAVGRSGNIAHFNGSGWQALNQGSTTDLRDICLSSTSAVAVGADGTVLRQVGTGWLPDNVGSGYDLAGVWESGETTIAVGRYTSNDREWREAALVKNGTSWVDAGVIGGAQRLFDVWGSSPTNVYAVGWAGEVLRFNGNNWGVVDAGYGDAAYLRSISGTSASNVIAVGRTNDLHGLVCRFDGLNWTKTEFYGTEELDGVWVSGPTTAYAVGARGVIRRLDGTSWFPTDSPTQESLFCVSGTSEQDVYVAGVNGSLFHFDGATWTQYFPMTNRVVYAIGTRSADEVYLAGERGAILRLGVTIEGQKKRRGDFFPSM